MSRAMPIWACLVACLVLSCAGGFEPWPVERVAFLDRAHVQERDGVRVKAAVPTKAETKKLFSENLYKRGVQPVWLEIENTREEDVMFLPVGTDASYYSPIQAANIDLGGDLQDTDQVRNRYFFDSSFNVWLASGQTRKGFIFTNLDEGTKSFNVDIVGVDDTIGFTFFIPVPGLKIDHHEVDWESLYPPDQIVDLDESTLIAAIAQEPCCATDKKGEGTADPLNIVVIGDTEDVYYAFLRAGWDETETITRSSLFKTIVSFITGGEYRYSPVSSLFVFGRKQDVAFQKARANIHERNHLRLWMSEARFKGLPVWIGQISRDIGVRFTRKTITTHKIDPNVDETREFLLEDLAYAQSLAKFAYAEGVGAAPMDEPRVNLTGDPYFTDGYRLVLWVTDKPVDLAHIEAVEWSIPPHRRP